MFGRSSKKKKEEEAAGSGSPLYLAPAVERVMALTLSDLLLSRGAYPQTTHARVRAHLDSIDKKGQRQSVGHGAVVCKFLFLKTFFFPFSLFQHKYEKRRNDQPSGREQWDNAGDSTRAIVAARVLGAVMFLGAAEHRDSAAGDAP
jgi:hypothetical protein